MAEITVYFLTVQCMFVPEETECIKPSTVNVIYPEIFIFLSSLSDVQLVSVLCHVVSYLTSQMRYLFCILNVVPVTAVL